MPPAGFRRSRALWDRARHRCRSSSPPSSSSLRRAGALVAAYAPAVLYELQPVRGSRLPGREELLRALAEGAAAARGAASRDVPAAARALLEFLRGRTARQWAGLAGALAYYWLVRRLHEWIRAGPVVLILTALGAIFTVGLGDASADGQLSAYSVFNRGMVRLLGDVQVEQLLAQHVGGAVVGGPAGAAGPAEGGGGRGDDDDEDWDPDEDGNLGR